MIVGNAEYLPPEPRNTVTRECSTLKTTLQFDAQEAQEAHSQIPGSFFLPNPRPHLHPQLPRRLQTENFSKVVSPCGTAHPHRIREFITSTYPETLKS